MKINEIIAHYQSMIDSPVFPELDEFAQNNIREKLNEEIKKQQQSEKQEIIMRVSELMQQLLKDSDMELSLLVTHDSNKTLAVREYYPPVEVDRNEEEDDNEGWVMEQNNIGVPDMFEAHEDLHADEPKKRKKKAKSVGFSVSFADGTVIHERRAVKTWIETLRKIGLDNIVNNQKKHEAWHNVDGKNICIVDRVETIRSTDKASPQELIDGYYVMTQLSNAQKVKDIESLALLWPKLKIKVTWDQPLPEPSGEATESIKQEVTKQQPKINEEAKFYHLPIKEQARLYMEQNVTESTANNYINILDRVVRAYITEKIDSAADSIFSYTTIDDVTLVMDMLNSDEEFRIDNSKRHNAMTAAMNQYLKFIRQHKG